MKTAPSRAAAAVALTLVALAGVQCAGTTGDHRVRFSGDVVGSGSDGRTALGWDLHFERFLVAFGPVRIYGDAPIARRAPRGGVHRLLAGLSWGTAFAQHCHGCPRAPLAEFGFESGGAVFRPVDLLASTPSPLGPANARNGLYRSVSFTFRAPVMIADGGVAASALEGHSMIVRGTARRGERTIPFEGSIDLHTQGEGDPSLRDLRPYTTYGVTFDRREGVLVDEPDESRDRVSVRVELARLFDQADFETLPASDDPSQPRRITPEAQVTTAWRFGVEDPRNWRVAWTGAGGSGAPRPRESPDAGL